MLDVKLAEDVDADGLVQRLNEVTLDGIDFLGAVRLGEGDRALGGCWRRAAYAARLPDGDERRSPWSRRFASDEPLVGGAGLLPRGGRGQASIGRRVDVRKSLRR